VTFIRLLGKGQRCLVSTSGTEQGLTPVRALLLAGSGYALANLPD